MSYEILNTPNAVYWDKPVAPVEITQPLRNMLISPSNIHDSEFLSGYNLALKHAIEIMEIVENRINLQLTGEWRTK